MEILFKPSVTELEEMHTSKMVVVEFVNALVTWVEVSLFKRLRKVPYLASGPMNALMLLP